MVISSWYGITVVVTVCECSFVVLLRRRELVKVLRWACLYVCLSGRISQKRPVLTSGNISLHVSWLWLGLQIKNVKVTHTQLQSVGFRSWSRFLAVTLQVMWVINPTVGCHYFPPGLQLPMQPLRGLLPILLLGEQRHNGCEQFA